MWATATRVAAATAGLPGSCRGTTAALLPDMRNSPRHGLRSLVERLEVEHHVLAKECEARWCDELESRRRAIAEECKRVFDRIRDAS
jgi:hypothetical protein